MAICYKYQKYINDYIDNDIDAARKIELEEHMKNCSSCQENLKNAKLLKKSLASLPRYRTSPTFDIVLRSKLKKEINKSSTLLNLPFLPMIRPVPAFAAFTIFLIFVGVLIGNSINILNKEKTTPKLIAVEKAGYGEEKEAEATQQADAAEQRLKMNNYVNVFEQFPVSTTGSRDLARYEYNGRRIEKIQNDSLSRVRNNPTSKPLIRQANASVHF